MISRKLQVGSSRWYIPSAPRKMDGPSTPSLDLDCVRAVEGDTCRSETWVGKRMIGAKYEKRTRIKDVSRSKGAR